MWKNPIADDEATDWKSRSPDSHFARGQKWLSEVGHQFAKADAQLAIGPEARAFEPSG